MNHFAIFALLYMASFLYEMVEKWKHVGFTWAFLILICCLILTGINRLKFLVFLLASTAYILLFRFPEVANHVNFILLLNIPLTISVIYSLRQPRSTHQDCFRLMRPFMQVALILAYFFAGFHKLNYDFFHPDVSCLGWFLGAFAAIAKSSRILFMPSALILLGMLVWAARSLGNPLKRISRETRFLLLALLTMATVASGSILLLMQQDRVPAGLRAFVIFAVAISVIAWEIIGGLLLLSPGFQGLALAFSAAMHASFAFIGFVDFSSLAFALIFCFIPVSYLTIFDEKSAFKIASRSFHRVEAYFCLLLLNGLLTGIHYRLGLNLGDMVFLHGLIFNVGIFIVAWPILITLCSPQRPTWEGVPLLTPQVSRLAVLSFALFIIFFGMNSYLGLRTAGNFSMFSNLRTEGDRSNHFLLGSNPLKLWGYQDDVVEVLEIDDDAAELGHKYRPLQGRQLPTVEFRKLIYKWTTANYTVPVTFRHDGTVYTSRDIVNDTVWQTPKRNWAMYAMDFRIIQPEGRNQCRW